jgi:hypothetical protein
MERRAIAEAMGDELRPLDDDLTSGPFASLPPEH